MSNQSIIPTLLHDKVIMCLKRYLLTANQFFNTTFLQPQIIYRNKGSIAGSALLNLWQIQINTNMLLENDENFIDEVIAHELAHLIAYKKFGRVKPHGKEWQSIMEQVFEREAKRTHHFQLPQSTIKKRHEYHCRCNKYLLTSIRHHKVQKNQVQYFCKNCGTILLYDKQDLI